MNPALERVIKAMGGGTKGVVALSFHTVKSPQAVYGWLNAGRIFDVLDALKVQEVAQGAGCEVTIEELAGRHNVAGGPQDGTRASADDASSEGSAIGQGRSGSDQEGGATGAAVASAQPKRGRGRPRTNRKVAAGRGQRRALNRRGLLSHVRPLIDRPDLSDASRYHDDVTILLRAPASLPATGTHS